jgi:Family of unknown function (DUF5946)
MKNFETYAASHGIELLNKGKCQFCGSAVTGGVVECHENVQILATLLDFNNPSHYESRFLSVDAMALQHCELHGPWNNHIHLTRLYLIFEYDIVWDYSKTPNLSNIINDFKKGKSESLSPPPPQHRGAITTVDLLKVDCADEAITAVKSWAKEVFNAYKSHHPVVSNISKMYKRKYPF